VVSNWLMTARAAQLSVISSKCTSVTCVAVTTARGPATTTPSATQLRKKADARSSGLVGSMSVKSNLADSAACITTERGACE
jgi:hypothetical protein